jgi:hypothetical protein
MRFDGTKILVMQMSEIGGTATNADEGGGQAILFGTCGLFFLQVGIRSFHITLFHLVV